MDKEPLKYKLKIYVDEKRIATKPYILNTFGHILKGFFLEFKDFSFEGPIHMELNDFLPENEKVKVIAADKPVELKSFVQDLIISTIFGFISSLSDIPDSFPDCTIKIEFEEKA